MLKISIFRFVDRDMIMRYYWGFAPGHVYTTYRPSESANTKGSDTNGSDQNEIESITNNAQPESMPSTEPADLENELDVTELQDKSLLEINEVMDSEDGNASLDEFENNEELLAWHEMYGE